MKRLMTSILVIGAVIVTTLSVGAGPASAATPPSSWAWSTNRTYVAGAVWKLQSPDGRHTAVWQSDSNWVVYHGSKATWSSRTGHGLFYSPPDRLEFSSRAGIAVAPYPCGHVCVLLWSNPVQVAIGTYHLAMQNDGNLVEYKGASGSKGALWATNTAGK